MALRSQYSDIFLSDALPLLDEVIMDEYNKYPDMVAEIFNVLPSDTWGEQSSTYAGLKAAVVKNEGEALAEDAPLQGYDKTYTHVTYGLMVGFSKELIRDNRLSLVQKTYRSLGLSAYQVRQVVAFNILNNSFSDTGPDGATLCATSHTMIGGHTYANRPSTDIALSVAGLRAMEVSMMRQVNHRNINVMIMPRTIVVPPDLSQTLDELVESPDRPDTDNRAMNSFYSKRYKKVVNPFLTSVTAWWGVSDPSQNELRFYDRQGVETDSWVDRGTKDVNTSIDFRISAGYSDFLGIYGTSG